jgi:2-polyprenyl-6-methoxyphenol hydroxylase-like FAD-dependent oxidoreductase
VADSHPIVIVGGGPAGALAAANLAGAGRKVILFDERIPRSQYIFVSD